MKRKIINHSKPWSLLSSVWTVTNSGCGLNELFISQQSMDGSHFLEATLKITYKSIGYRLIPIDCAQWSAVCWDVCQITTWVTSLLWILIERKLGRWARHGGLDVVQLTGKFSVILSLDNHVGVVHIWVGKVLLSKIFRSNYLNCQKLCSTEPSRNSPATF